MRYGFASIATYANPVEAAMACERVRAAGIEAELTNASAASSMYGAGNPIMDQVLYVEAVRMQEAIKLLSTVGEESPEFEILDDTPVAAMPTYDGFYRSDWNSRERDAETAYRAAIIGWFVPLVSWYGLWKLTKVVFSGLPLNGQARRHAAIAGVAALIPAVGWGGLLVAIALT